MKNKLLLMLIAVAAFLGFTAPVKAETVPAAIMSGPLVKTKDYVPGIYGYTKKTADQTIYLYCEAAHLKYQSGVQMNLVGPLEEGFVYLMQNRPDTGDSYKDYYIVQVAVWWYKDIVNGNDANLTAAQKQHMDDSRNTDQTCGLIYNLVHNAISYHQAPGTIKFSDGTINFTEKDGSFVSEEISLKTTNLSSLNALQVINAPKGTTIINNTLSNNNYNGTFQIKVPVESVPAGSTVNFSLKIDGTYDYLKVYDYFYNSAYQKVILDHEYATPSAIVTSKNLSISRPEEETPHNQLVIAKVDENGASVEDAKLVLYKGNCTETTCEKEDLVETWTSTKDAKTFTDLEIGKYTLVEATAPKGYRLASKMLINVNSESGVFSYSMIDKHDISVRISKTTVTGDSELPGATLTVKSESGNVIDTWVSTDKAHYVVLAPGVYTLSETIAPEGYLLSATSITFKVDDEGTIYEKNANGDYIKVDHIKMVNDVKPSVSISKLDSDNNTFVKGAVLVIKDVDGKEVARWTTGEDLYYVSLNPGEYILTEESAPEGYNLNPEPIYFKLDDKGVLTVKNETNEYLTADGIIMYDVPVGEVIEVPKTGLSSSLTYIIGAGMLAAGAVVLVKYGKEN